MKSIQLLAACVLLISDFASAAPAYNGTVKGDIDGNQLDVQVVCERRKIGTMDLLSARSDPSMSVDAKDRNGDGIAVSISGDMVQKGAAFTMLAGGKVYKFGASKNVKMSDTGLSFKANIRPAPDKPNEAAYDVNLTLACS